MDVALINEVTGLSIEEIKELKQISLELVSKYQHVDVGICIF